MTAFPPGDDYRNALAESIGNPWLAGLVYAAFDAWRDDWRAMWRAGHYIPWPEYLCFRIDDIVMSEAGRYG